ncbi:hypothetical protein H0H93_006695 [Arthromyces matolae]|nr:hypothetical protein H0H93_006695 [Arthromyces matolae]
MAAVATPIYYPHSFITQPIQQQRTSNLIQRSLPPSQSPLRQQQEDSSDDEDGPPLFCRALYDYNAQDVSALSFRRGDIIEILTQEPSGWWDGLLGEERGWFPSNYVEVIPDDEAEFLGAEYSSSEISNLPLVDSGSSIVDVTHPLIHQVNQEENEEWLKNELLSPKNNDNRRTTTNKLVHLDKSQTNDYWVPSVGSDGQIFYVNTQTGQRSRYIPQEADVDISDTDLAGFGSQMSSIRASGVHNAPLEVDFGIPRRTGTPEPWVRKLHDDGRSFYYFNKEDGRSTWSRPEGPTKTSAPTPSQPKNNRLSVYSDNSGIHPIEASSRALAEGQAVKPLSRRAQPSARVLPDFTAAERIAQSLQQAITPPPPLGVTELAAMADSAIHNVLNSIDMNEMTRRPEEVYRLDRLVSEVVLTTRNLLYSVAVPTLQIPQNVLPLEVKDIPTSSPPQALLKSAQRKVTATLSRLILSTRAIQYDPVLLFTDTLSQIKVDAIGLRNDVADFVVEIQRFKHVPNASRQKLPKRLQGVFSVQDVGPGLVGAGSAGRWKGFGWIAVDEETAASRKVLGPEVISQVRQMLKYFDDHCQSHLRLLRISTNPSLVEKARLSGRELVSQASSILNYIFEIHVARHVDIGGFLQDGSGPYGQTIATAQQLVRKLEAVMQATHDDISTFILTLQSIKDSDHPQDRDGRKRKWNRLITLTSTIAAHTHVLMEVVDGILSLGHKQAEMSSGDYNGSIEWRLSRHSMRPVSNYNANGEGNPELVSMEMVFGRTPVKAPQISYSSSTDPSSDASHTAVSSGEYDSTNTLVSDDEDVSDPLRDEDESLTLEDEPILGSLKSPQRPTNSRKLKQLLGKEYSNKVAADSKPRYLRPDYTPEEILTDHDNSVKGGTLPALVERLTPHDQVDPSFNQAFLMTFKFFTSVDDLFDLLVARFRIEPPPDLNPDEFEDWTKQKKNFVQLRVINTFVAMLRDDDLVGKEDHQILQRLQAFVTSDEVSQVPAAKQVLVYINRAARKDSHASRTMASGSPPSPIYPKTAKKLKLTDIEPLELARQLTIMESNLYMKIKPVECLQRAREPKTESLDTIATIIQMSNRIADWVAECVLSREDSRKRAATIKHLINVADRCRALNNFSSMIAITSGLDRPPVRRLKRTWELLNQRTMAQFTACEMTIESIKNINKYRQLMALVKPPCVPFLDGNPDYLPGGLVHFRKWQKAFDVINDIKLYQTQLFNLQPIPLIQTFIEDSLSQFNDTKASSDQFWALSLELEPREREDEKMARLLQESGFL